METPEGVVVLDQIPVNLDTAAVLKQMHVHGDTRRYETYIQEMIALVTPVARPKIMYRACCVEKREAEYVIIDGVRFDGRLISDTLDGIDTVFVCVGTCGKEVDAIELPASEVMKRYCLDQIKMALVFTATVYFEKYLKEHYPLKELSRLSPGEIKAFPSSQHRNIFAILGDVEGKIGLKLTENCALVPTKSHSGVYFSKDTQFISCKMCTQKRCPGRRAPYDPELAKPYLQ
jgi:hypothetical protein